MREVKARPILLLLLHLAPVEVNVLVGYDDND